MECPINRPTLRPLFYFGVPYAHNKCGVMSLFKLLTLQVLISQVPNYNDQSTPPLRPYKFL